ncbi:putative ribosomally synthesized peptide with SipW-like signal peptide [Alkalibacillus filiformis]|uniref:Ribosomally synthesized peptide with SipW-like signal peptide n=1 Tax=Alkalibacillus filiformis TaxID=200990 RepID=A0ABU0DVT8_9BACI|nr:TasA family protein [Alkalibacillus filiformis]MDQ0352574.1 putative ribosomally synthesized peptide with SipW-like signal peptide [Alkalibacillus filiformis]
MKNTKKVLGTLALTGAILAGGAFGTYSYFSDEDSTTGSVEAGTLGISVGELFSEENFAPGKTASATPEVTNEGSLPMFVGYNFDIEVSDGHGEKYYLEIKLPGEEEGTKKTVDGWNAYFAEEDWNYLDEALLDGEALELEVIASLDESAGNDYQESEINVTLNVMGVQQFDFDYSADAFEAWNEEHGN